MFDQLPKSPAEASALGSLRYFTGNPCPRGHVSPRYTSTHACIECHYLIADRLKAETAARRSKRVLSPRQQAKRNGAPRYWTGEPCKDGHVAERRTSSGSCVECARLIRLRLDATEPHRKVRKAAYRKSQAERYRSHARNRRAKVRHIDGAHTHEDVDAILKAQKGRCAYCRCALGDDYHVDHIIPLSGGGTNGRRNLQVTCEPCNLRKHAKDPIAFARELGKLV